MVYAVFACSGGGVVSGSLVFMGPEFFVPPRVGLSGGFVRLYGGEMLTNMRKRTALLLSLAVVCATVALVPQTAGAVATVVPNAGTLTDPHTAPANLEVMKACPGNSASWGRTPTRPL